MRATDVLLREHRVIESVLGCLEAATGRGETGGEIVEASFRDCVRFFRGFADGLHHRKEEDSLFPMLERHGVPREGGPIGVMLEEHDAGREHVAAIERHLEDALAGRAGAMDDLARHARGLAELLREHIEKEDEVLFPLANEVLPPEECDRLEDSFADLDTERDVAVERGELLALAERLCREWGVEYPGA